MITALWNFLNVYEDQELNKERLPIQGLAMSAPKKQRRILGQLALENRPIHQEDCKEKVSEKEKSVGRVAPSGVLSAHDAHSARWRNGIFNGRSLRELFNHCNGVVSDTNRIIHSKARRNVDH